MRVVGRMLPMRQRSCLQKHWLSEVTFLTGARMSLME